jgi:farnesyl-diphosphate farnesyltransferase
MGMGMGQFQLRGDKIGLQDLEELDQYCYYVAGVVGQMLTTLFCLYSPEIAKNHDALMASAVSFGQGLQMTNILKDVWEDFQRGDCWLPRRIFADEGFDLSGVRARCSAPRRHRPSAFESCFGLYFTHYEAGEWYP